MAGTVARANGGLTKRASHQMSPTMVSRNRKKKAETETTNAEPPNLSLQGLEKHEIAERTIKASHTLGKCEKYL